jgi:hypothetical protein
MKGMERIPIEVGAWDPGSAPDTGDKEHLLHIHFQFIDRPQNEAHQNAVTTAWTEGRPLNSWPKIFLHRPDHLDPIKSKI